MTQTFILNSKVAKNAIGVSQMRSKFGQMLLPVRNESGSGRWKFEAFKMAEEAIERTTKGARGRSFPSPRHVL
jgi:hypothetical protein